MYTKEGEGRRKEGGESNSGKEGGEGEWRAKKGGGRKEGKESISVREGGEEGGGKGVRKRGRKKERGGKEGGKERRGKERSKEGGREDGGRGDGGGSELSKTFPVLHHSSTSVHDDTQTEEPKQRKPGNRQFLAHFIIALCFRNKWGI